MSEASPPPLEEPIEPTSIFSKLFDIIAAPGDVYEEIRGARVAVVNWLVPVLLAGLAVGGFSYAAFSRPSVVHELRTTQEKAIRKSLEKQKMAPEKVEKVIEQTQKFMTTKVLMMFGIGGGVLGLFVFLFVKAFALWVLDRIIFKSGTDFLKFLEITGLADVVTILSSIAKIFLVMAKGNLYLGFSPALFLPEFDITNTPHLLLNTIELFLLWNLIVIGIGVRVVTRASWSRVLSGLFVLWMLFVTMAVVPLMMSQ